MSIMFYDAIANLKYKLFNGHNYIFKLVIIVPFELLYFHAGNLTCI